MYSICEHVSVDPHTGLIGKVPSNVVPFACEGCVEGKQAKQPFPNDGGTRATKVLELVHSDVCRPRGPHPWVGGGTFSPSLVISQGKCRCY